MGSREPKVLPLKISHQTLGWPMELWLILAGVVVSEHLTTLRENLAG
jgi:hypothetical protein